MNTKNKPHKAALYFNLFLYLSMGGLSGFLAVRHIKTSVRGSTSLGEYMLIPCLVILFFYITIILQLVIHEAGHLLFGLLTGYHFLSFRIGSLMWIRKGGKIHLRKMSLAGTGGQCLMCPPASSGRTERIPYVLYNLGGSILNAVSALIFLGLYFLSDGIPYLPAFFLLMGITGIGLALMNGIPMRGTVNNDGHNALSLGRAPAALRSYWLQMKINEQMAKGIRLKDMPEEWFQFPSEGEMQNSMAATIAVFCANRLMDEHRFKEAANLIDQLLSMDTAIISIHRCLLICDRLYCELIGDNKETKIHKLLTIEQVRFMKQMRNFPAVIRTGYACALLYEKDAKKAERYKKQFESKCALTNPYESDIASERELMETAFDVSQDKRETSENHNQEVSE